MDVACLPFRWEPELNLPDRSVVGNHHAPAVATGTRTLDTLAFRAIPLLIACAMVINTYSYSLVTAIPLIQSDAWRYLDGFLGKFIEQGFSPMDLFVQANPADTNLPLQKLLLFFHTHYYGMDFRLEGLAGTLSGILLVGLLTRAAAAAPVLRWGAREYWLLAGLALPVLSLNSTNVYTWPLATLWFLPLLLAATYMWFVYARPHARFGIFCATVLLGLVLDEVAFPVIASVYGALLLAHQSRQAGQLPTFTVYGFAGLAASRLLYWVLGMWASPGIAFEPSHRSLGAFFDPAIWKAAVIPLTDSLVHQANQASLFGSGAAAYVWIAGIGLLVAHAWFWWRAIFTRNTGGQAFAMVTLMAMAVMLLFYGLVAGILVQRVPEFGFEYFHQPRYMLFYALHLAALVMLLYREQRYVVTGVRARQILGGVLVAVILLFSALQLRLSTLAWEHAKYLSAYVVGVSHSMGRLVDDPASTSECADIMTICEFPPAKRLRLLNILINYRLNLFSPDFQAFYRVQPFPPRPPEAKGTVDGKTTPGDATVNRARARPDAIQ